MDDILLKTRVKKERKYLFNDAFNTFYGYMALDI